MTAVFARRRATEWRWEQGPGHDLRQYHRGRPTGLVAVAACEVPHRASQVVDGPDVWLIREPGRVVVVEHRSGPGAVRLHIPLRALVGVELVEEPGLPGSSLIRMTMTVRLGPEGTFTVPLWFPKRARPTLDDLVRFLRGSELPARPAPAEPPPEPTLAPLPVDRAPDDEDWVVFRPASGDELLTTRQEEEPR